MLTEFPNSPITKTHGTKMRCTTCRTSATSASENIFAAAMASTGIAVDVDVAAASVDIALRRCAASGPRYVCPSSGRAVRGARAMGPVRPVPGHLYISIPIPIAVPALNAASNCTLPNSCHAHTRHPLQRVREISRAPEWPIIKNQIQANSFSCKPLRPNNDIEMKVICVCACFFMLICK